MAKKIVLWLLPAVIAAGTLYLFLRPGPSDFKRVTIPADTADHEQLWKPYHINHYRMKGGHYFEKGNTTFKGSGFILTGGRQILCLEPRLKGTYVLAVDTVVRPKNRIKINIYQNRTPLADESFQKEKIFPFKTRVKLAPADRIHIFLKGRGAVIVGDLLFYALTPAREREYVFLICADTLRADHLPTYGYARQTAPRIDEFARQATVFESAYAQAPWTLPSHISLFSGQYEFHHGAKRGTMISERVPFLVEELSGKFITRSFNGGIYVSSRFGFFRGFDRYHSSGADQISPLATQKLVDSACRDIGENDSPRAFYFLHTYQTHGPYNPLPRYLHRFNKQPKYMSLAAPIIQSAHRNKYEKLGPEMKKAYIDLYDAEIAAFDEGFGRFIDFLKQKNIFHQSMIILFSDHGEEFYDHQGWEHGHSLYDELIRVPLIIKFPGEKYEGKRIKQAVGLIDIMPTILNYYDVDFDAAGIDGLDLLPIIKGETPGRTLLSSLTSGTYLPAMPFKISLIEKHEKIIYNLPFTAKTFAFFKPPPPSYQKYELYDLVNDPAETINLYLRQLKRIKSFQNLFDQIVQMADDHLKNRGRNVILDRKMQEAFKSLGYL
jgi:arylsulfatase A-like enzyme